MDGWSDVERLDEQQLQTCADDLGAFLSDLLDDSVFEVPLTPSGSLAEAEQHTYALQSPGGAEAGPHDDAQAQAAHSTQSNSRPRRARGRRTSIQQQQNKLAQKRYRERRKERTNELERRVEELVAELNAVQEGGAGSLEAEKAALQSQVTEQQQMIEALRRKLESMGLAAETSRPSPAVACAGLACVRTSPTPVHACEAVSRSNTIPAPEDALAQIVELVGCVRNALSASKGQGGGVDLANIWL